MPTANFEVNTFFYGGMSAPTLELVVLFVTVLLTQCTVRNHTRHAIRDYAGVAVVLARPVASKALPKQGRTLER